MKKVLSLLLAAMLLAALPGAALADGTGGSETTVEAGTREEGRKGTIVNCKTSVNVREKATSKSKLLGTAKKGAVYDVTGTFGNWVRIDFDGREGYVYKTYIRVDGTPGETAVEGKVGRIVNCKTSVNVREKAASGSKLLGTAKKGATFPVLATAGNWVKIQYKSETAGYVYRSYVKISDEGTEPADPTGKTGTIVNCRVAANVREKAMSDSKLLGTVRKGETYTVLGASGNWVKIDFDGREGYVFHTYIKVTGEETPIEGKTGTIQCVTKVNVRSKATKNSKLLGTAKNGETFTVKGKSGNWIRIDFNGKTGYVYKTYIRID
ncbi:MAG: SH3 domain-containing protein [Clostridia bacterium]|nr:SH3 domain-containing protein [Clostridia bacterium]